MRTDIGSALSDAILTRRSDASMHPSSASCATHDAEGAAAGRAHLRGDATGRDGVVVENKEGHETLLTREEVIIGFSKENMVGKQVSGFPSRRVADFPL